MRTEGNQMMPDAENLELVRMRLAGLGRGYQPADVAQALRGLGLVVSDAMVLRTLEELRRTSIGAGPLEPLLHLDGVTDVLVNGPGQVFVDRGQGLERSELRFGDDDQVRRLAVRLAASVGRRLDEASPCVDARLADGTRVHAVLGGIADPGTCLSLRVPSHQAFPLERWVSTGSLSRECADLLASLVASRTAFLVSGGTGSGKTTLLASLLSLVPERERLLIVEDSRELAPDHPHCVRLEARQPNAEGIGAVSLTHLVRQALRMRPDRLVLGEVRGAELCDLLTALNTGHEGGCGTVHANSATDVPARLEALAALGGMGRDACHAQVASALRVVVHVRRWPSGSRGVAQIGVVRRQPDRTIEVVEAIGFDASARPRRGPAWDELMGMLS
ncbi:pilus assembly protein CpaF [Luteococcus japonicus]|uniref:Flp pilus assembly protein, ATPase CpaF n=2 Tax=Luteococcus japonicus TaxID=33984 RepID=A0A1R4K2D9_9ACTN|nr:TadA family conjugal transfer-associated ATPase [Luteococcus japonicus]ROR54382.1 pilus assembly protein CpaF [Luteococcus japonicus]SJN38419.1 Flp pilus assembly protein, ATPase CpaF [Luteococcus japonicus LSP_Lj1]